MTQKILIFASRILSEFLKFFLPSIYVTDNDVSDDRIA